jgi:hypothetical protein
VEAAALLARAGVPVLLVDDGGGGGGGGGAESWVRAAEAAAGRPVVALCAARAPALGGAASLELQLQHCVAGGGTVLITDLAGTASRQQQQRARVPSCCVPL